MRSLTGGIVMTLGCLVTSALAVDAKPIVRVGSKAFTESVILAEALKHLAQSARARSEQLDDLGRAQVCWKSLLARPAVPSLMLPFVFRLSTRGR